MDSGIRTRTPEVLSEGVRDQYADGKAAKIWKAVIGDEKQRTQVYKDFLMGLLRENGCKRILDVACGTGIDSIMLIEEGFQVVSVDASDKMLKYALKDRWDRRKEPGFDDWVIEEANWLTLTEDIGHLIGDGFDAVICLGNSFAHIHDTYGDQREQKQILKNFEMCLKPGGFLLIDHRNFDAILDGESPHMKEIRTSVYSVSGVSRVIIQDYFMSLDEKNEDPENQNHFRLTGYPHRLNAFKDMLREIFSQKTHKIFGDFKPLNEVKVPGCFIHLIEKK
ncbi:glycine N-methyltransferase isoform X2 [Microplitis demolitor]|uniref:glycine N-methyltransferase isoform X2 n=1 Tax=Microplitis demolitor TaxID=69319 RepID=UPI00235B66C2|nr:glycine N-methyltransferase isoform X2 [Microplitis demolitor]